MIIYSMTQFFQKKKIFIYIFKIDNNNNSIFRTKNQPRQLSTRSNAKIYLLALKVGCDTYFEKKKNFYLFFSHIMKPQTIVT